jgi:hypothetical protein
VPNLAQHRRVCPGWVRGSLDGQGDIVSVNGGYQLVTWITHRQCEKAVCCFSDRRVTSGLAVFGVQASQLGYKGIVIDPRLTITNQVAAPHDVFSQQSILVQERPGHLCQKKRVSLPSEQDPILSFPLVVHSFCMGHQFS